MACLLAGSVAFAGTGLKQDTSKRHYHRKHTTSSRNKNSSGSYTHTGAGTGNDNGNGTDNGNTTGRRNGSKTVPPTTHPPKL
jgi:hypothetical protein